MPRTLVRSSAVVVLLVSLALAALRHPRRAVAAHASQTTLYSLLAVGDTGKRPRLFSLFDTLPNVARGLADEAAREPVHGLVLLGDNFYPDGLEARELTDRLAENVASPFCPFVRLRPPELPALASACPAAQRRWPVPIYAVLGNHDEHAASSVFLEREIVPRYIENWHVPQSEVETFELPHGLSLVAIGSSSSHRPSDPSAVTEALARSRGPWRIVAVHYPLHEEPAAEPLRHAIEAAGVPVQLLLAGHEHSLQARAIGAPGPALEIVAGSGSNVDPIPAGGPSRLFTAERPGFARVDLVDAGGTPRLVVSLVATGARGVWNRLTAPSVVSRWSVGLEGDVRSEAP